ncbi:hypothetical protein SAMN05216436_107132 [bacterium A37T11]|nr:hypothetical protein SAMN05216436_107132 [bacterium A37T11]
MTTNVVAQVFDTVLSTPGMSEVVKIDLKISRKNVLLLNEIIKRGLSGGDDTTRQLANVPKEDLQDLTNLSNEILQKAMSVELSEKLNSLTIVK